MAGSAVRTPRDHDVRPQTLQFALERVGEFVEQRRVRETAKGAIRKAEQDRRLQPQRGSRATRLVGSDPGEFGATRNGRVSTALGAISHDDQIDQRAFARVTRQQRRHRCLVVGMREYRDEGLRRGLADEPRGRPDEYCQRSGNRGDAHDAPRLRLRLHDSSALDSIAQSSPVSE
jgi:hypothetical protein